MPRIRTPYFSGRTSPSYEQMYKKHASFFVNDDSITSRTKSMIPSQVDNESSGWLTLNFEPEKSREEYEFAIEKVKEEYDDDIKEDPLLFDRNSSVDDDLLPRRIPSNASQNHRNIDNSLHNLDKLETTEFDRSSIKTEESVIPSGQTDEESTGCQTSNFEETPSPNRLKSIADHCCYSSKDFKKFVTQLETSKASVLAKKPRRRIKNLHALGRTSKSSTVVGEPFGRKGSLHVIAGHKLTKKRSSEKNDQTVQVGDNTTAESLRKTSTLIVDNEPGEKTGDQLQTGDQDHLPAIGMVDKKQMEKTGDGVLMKTKSVLCTRCLRHIPNYSTYQFYEQHFEHCRGLFRAHCCQYGKRGFPTKESKLKHFNNCPINKRNDYHKKLLQSLIDRAVDRYHHTLAENEKSGQVRKEAVKLQRIIPKSVVSKPNDLTSVETQYCSQATETAKPDGVVGRKPLVIFKISKKQPPSTSPDSSMPSLQPAVTDPGLSPLNSITTELSLPIARQVSVPSNANPESSPRVSTPQISEPVSITPNAKPDSTPSNSKPESSQPVSTPQISEPVSITPNTEPVSTPPISEPVSITSNTEPVSTPPISEPVSIPPDVKLGPTPSSSKPTSVPSKISSRFNYFCDECGESFSSTGQFMMHKMIKHSTEGYNESKNGTTGARSFCYKCKKDFSSFSEYFYHIRSDHSIQHVHVITKAEAMDPNPKSLCPFCKCRYQDLTSHILRIHKTSILFMCPECNRQFDNHVICLRHIAAVHDGPRPFQCSQCYSSFAAHIDLESHEKIHPSPLHPFSLTYCHKCKKQFQSTSKLLWHVREKHAANNVNVADGVEISEEVESELIDDFLPPPKKKKKRIRKKKKSTVITTIPEHYCYKCKKEFKFASDFDWHVRIAHSLEKIKEITKDAASTPLIPERKYKPRVGEPKPEKCPFCDNEYINLKSHISRVHERVLRYPCAQCDMKFNNVYSRQTHIAVKHNGPRVLCHLCGRSFAAMNLLKSHQITHGERNLVCDYCESKFKEKYSLAAHCRQHGDIRPYKCNYCKMKFRQTVTRRVHQIKKHTKEFPMLCYSCGEKFVFPKELKDHKKKKGCQ